MVTLTETASRKLSELLSQQSPPVLGLRLSVKQGGCSGYSYGMSFAESAEPGDWVESLQATGFAIRNPNAARSCGCGKSFETHQH